MIAESETINDSVLAGTLPIAVVREFLGSIGGGFDVNEALRVSAIPPSLIDDDRARVSVDQASRFVRYLWRSCGDELMGLGVEPLPRGAFRLLGLCMVHASDLNDAWERFCEFSRVIRVVPTAVIEVDCGQVRVSLDVRGAGMRDPSAALLLAVVHRFSSWLVSRRLDAALVELPQNQPQDRTHLDLVFGAPLRFGSDTPALWFDAHVLQSPVTQDEDSLTTYLAQCPQVWLSRRDFGTTIDDRVRRVLARSSLADWPSHDDLARAMSMSPQTLRRRLRERGTSVAEMKETIRRDMAITSLSAGDESVAEISARLGFSEPSAFNRAFRRWTGQAPGAYRSSGAT
jgi:AraC-like DNA-binding protein